MEIGKYKELYNLSIKVLKEDHERFIRIDDKAVKYLSVFTLLIGIYGFFTKWIIENIIPPESFLDLLLILISLILMASIYYTWLIIFKIIKIKPLYKMPIDVEFFDKHDLFNIYHALARGNKEALNKNMEVTNKKAELLDKGYNWINITVIIIIIFSILFGINIYIKQINKNINFERRFVMAEEQGTKPQGDGGTSSEKPNTKIKAPEYIIVQEGIDPSKIRGKINQTMTETNKKRS